jgi:uncharacterized OB-fold protein
LQSQLHHGTSGVESNPILPHESRTCSTQAVSAATSPSSAAPLGAPLIVDFPYTRSLGPILGGFLTALRDRQILGIRGSDGRVHSPPLEYDPVSNEPLSELVEVGPGGEVISWSWMPNPLEGQPLTDPFAWALIRLDGADTPMLHAVDVPAGQIRTGLRVRARWVDEPIGSIRDLACFEPEVESTEVSKPASNRTPIEPEAKTITENGGAEARFTADPVTMLTTTQHGRAPQDAGPKGHGTVHPASGGGPAALLPDPQRSGAGLVDGTG